MITKTFKDLSDWIMQQPDDKAVDMREMNAVDPCGCVLTQFARSCGVEFDGCGFRGVSKGGSTVIAFDAKTGQFISLMLRLFDDCTFSQIKQQLLQN